MFAVRLKVSDRRNVNRVVNGSAHVCWTCHKHITRRTSREKAVPESHAAPRMLPGQNLVIGTKQLHTPPYL